MATTTTTSTTTAMLSLVLLFLISTKKHKMWYRLIFCMGIDLINNYIHTWKATNYCSIPWFDDMYN
ncbi:hypothetical protein BCR42DRAFT_429552 [Absidia repens]|uniref:Uncharacterized protein n=1 Tax=Absidia repens TaxID=90262 RepID=A0A1X2HWU3_9FUNG|nr:hypothetical protein BCR42DRAFT_429552 [Absidia repens]